MDVIEKYSDSTLKLDRQRLRRALTAMGFTVNDRNLQKVFDAFSRGAPRINAIAFVHEISGYSKATPA